MTDPSRKPAQKNPLLGAAVVKAVLRKRTGDSEATSTLYEGILRDLGVTDAQVEGESEGRRHRLVLDFGHFGREGPAGP